MDLNAYSQTETFDIISFTPPQSWKRDIQAGSVSFTISRGNIFCVAGLYASRAVKAISETEFLIMQLMITGKIESYSFTVNLVSQFRGVKKLFLL